MEINHISNSKLYLDICSKKRIIKHKKEIKYLKDLCKTKQIPRELERIMISILLVETHYRNFVFRMIEYVAVLISIALNLLFNKPIKNYTIGVFQTGLSYVLNHDGFKIYKHIEYFKDINISMIISILSSFYYKKNIEVSFYRILGYYTKINITTGDRLISRRIGEMYNRTYEYGILIQNIERELEMIYLEISEE